MISLTLALMKMRSQEGALYAFWFQVSCYHTIIKVTYETAVVGYSDDYTMTTVTEMSCAFSLEDLKEKKER